MNFKRQLKEGLLTKNPVLVQLLGMCSALAISTSLFNGLGMGVAVTVILICSPNGFKHSTVAMLLPVDCGVTVT